jgi:hypothetical protein
MNILFYAPVMDREGRQLYRQVEKRTIEWGLEVHRSLESLSRRLRQPMNEVRAAILYTVRREDFLEMLSIRDLLGDIRIILVLPDRTEEILRRGHNFKPSFLAFPGDDQGAVTSVLDRLIALNPPAPGTNDAAKPL